MVKATSKIKVWRITSRAFRIYDAKNLLVDSGWSKCERCIIVRLREYSDAWEIVNALDSNHLRVPRNLKTEIFWQQRPLTWVIRYDQLIVLVIHSHQDVSWDVATADKLFGPAQIRIVYLEFVRVRCIVRAVRGSIVGVAVVRQVSRRVEIVEKSASTNDCGVVDEAVLVDVVLAALQVLEWATQVKCTAGGLSGVIGNCWVDDFEVNISDLNHSALGDGWVIGHKWVVKTDCHAYGWLVGVSWVNGRAFKGVKVRKSRGVHLEVWLTQTHN